MTSQLEAMKAALTANDLSFTVSTAPYSAVGVADVTVLTVGDKHSQGFELIYLNSTEQFIGWNTWDHYREE